MKSAWILGLMMVLLFVLPEAAYACPVCFDASDENRQAFLATTALLSLLPLGMVGGVGMWMRRRVQQMDGEAGDGNAEEPPQSES